MMYKLRFLTLICAAFCVASSAAMAQLATAWHIPDNNTDVTGGIFMRSPRFEIGSSTAVTIYQGVWLENGGTNQTGGVLYYKGATQGVWSSVALDFHENKNGNQYWKATFNSSAFAANEVIQYYVQVNSNKPTTYIYAGDNGTTTVYGDNDSRTTGTQATAASNPFTVRNRPAWIFHAGNRVVTGNDVQFWAKLGYMGKNDELATRWADRGAVFYTTDGSAPNGSINLTTGNPVGAGTTQVVEMTFSHRENDNSIAGNAMWWFGTVTGLPTATNIRYKVGFWHSQNRELKFAEYNTSTNNATFSFSIGAAGDPVLTVNGVNGNYTTTKFFIDEVAGDSVPVNVTFSPGQANVTEVEVYTNLNRRERAQLDANGDGIEDGVQPVDGNTITAAMDNHYYKANVMNSVGSGQYTLTLQGQKTGAYRLTARWKVSGDPAWRWYTNTGANRRDHAITVSPVDARNINLYEINTLNIEASGDTFAQRSTFEDLFNASNAPHNANNRWDLDYLKNLGANWLWFQPIHPPGIDGRENDPSTGQPYEPGSPYAVKNFFEVSAVMSVHNSRAGAMAAFQGFVAAADTKGVGIMLDAPFNHTAFDVELAQIGVDLFQPDGQSWSPTDQIRNRDARFFSRAGAYNERAFSAASTAPAPDREDFGKWNDTKDVFFGVYAALVHSGQNGNHTNEGDWFDYTNPNWTANDYTKNSQPQNVTKNAWKYFAEYTLFWLDKTGVPAGSNLATQTANGVDGLRADFGQGLPPQLWEYIINKTRTRKWNFVFMSESLDGGAVTYRSNRHFDILNENIVFPLKSASNPASYRGIFEDRRNWYGQGLVLTNNTSHDEENYDDPWQALVRYAVAGTVDGVPMIFPGQELGISRTFGYDRYELNFGKTIAHFKRYNSMMPAWNDSDFGNDQLYPVYSGIGLARQFSPALRSSNRWFVDPKTFVNDQTDAGYKHIYRVAKYETANASPNVGDVVFAFVNLDRNNNQADTFNINITQNGSNLFGIKSDRTYNIKNIAAYIAQDPNRRNVFIWSDDDANAANGIGKTGANLLANGLFVAMNKVPASQSAWTTAPYEAQYLKVYDVTPPPAAGAPGTPKAYAIGNNVTFSWSAASDPDGGISGYRVIISTEPNGGGTVLFDGIVNGTSKSITGSFDQTLFAKITSINNAGIEGGTSLSASGTILLDPAGDKDGDGMNNENEDVASTDPLNNASIFKVTSVERAGNDVVVTWNSVAGKAYVVQSRTSLTTGNWADIPGSNTTASGSTASYTHVGATGESYYYRVRLAP